MLALFDTFSLVSIIIVSVFVVIPLLGLLIWGLISIRNKNYVLKHSLALQEINKLNDKYKFKIVENFDYTHQYDNEYYYEDISCEDYLTYKLVRIQNRVKVALEDTLYNKGLFEAYTKEVNDKVKTNTFEVINPQNFSKHLIRVEEKLIKENLQDPTVSFSINIKLILTRINGAFVASKEMGFFPKQIKDIIYLLNQKRRGFYLNRDIWDSLCRVERGRVTNKLRFAVYERDHYRCRKCGRKTNDLEIDHIIPISKSGKSTYDNLQTLCHRCNLNKGNDFE